jgi:hypothetical protein
MSQVNGQLQFGYVAMEQYGQLVRCQHTKLTIGIYSGSGNLPERIIPGAVNMTGPLAGKFIIGITGGYRTLHVLASDGTVFGWGNNQNNQLATGSGIVYNTPVQFNMSIVPSNVSFVQISASNDALAALGNDGYVILYVLMNSNIYWSGDNQRSIFGDGSAPLSTTASNGRTFLNESLQGTKVRKIIGTWYSAYALYESVSTPVPTPTPVVTTTIGPITTSIPTTTVVPITTTSMPTSTPTTTSVPTTTSTPTVVITVQGTVSTQVTGNVPLLPPPVVANSLVLFTNSSVTSSLPITFASNTSIPSNAKIQDTTINFNVTYIAGSATLAVILSDVEGNQAGNTTVVVSSAGIVSVNLKDVLANVLALFPGSYTIRAIRGAILKVSIQTTTPDVPINIDPVVSSTLSYSTVATPTPAPTTAPTPSDSSIYIAGIVTGTVVASVLLLIGTIMVVVVIIIVISVIRGNKDESDRL